MLIGLTGGIGSGKSLVLDYLKEANGFNVINSDAVVAELYKTAEAKAFVSEHLGKQFINASGEVDKKVLAQFVFKHPQKLQELEDFLHPKVFDFIKLNYIKQDVPCIVEMPLIYEGGYQEQFDKVVVIACSEATQIARLLEKGYTQEEATARIAEQLPTNEKMEKADHVIWNDGNKDALHAQVKELIKILKGQ